MLGTLRRHARADGPHYKWVALSNTTLGVLMAAMNGSIVIISLPAIFRGIGLDPLGPGNIGYLLWALMGYTMVTAVLVVTFGRLGDLFGRSRMYNLGFVVFTLASVALALLPGRGELAALYLIGLRVVQGVGGALLMANSTAILTDAFPSNERGLALGINSVAAIGGSFVGLLVGGLVATIHWRMVFWVSVPFGIVGSLWAYLALRDLGEARRTPIDWWGNLTFGAGLILLLLGITYGIQPHGAQAMSWASPSVLFHLGSGLILLGAFVFVELRAAAPMFDLRLFRIRPFAAGNAASLLSAVGRGGLQLMLIIWLQGVWLPLHGYSFASAPLWAGIFMLPLTMGFLAAAPLSGYFSDRYGARPFATGGMLLGALSFVFLMLLPADFPYWLFALVVFLNGVGSGLFAAPNSTGIMNAVPAGERGQASGMRATTINTGMALSIGIFFSLIIIGLARSLPVAVRTGLIAEHVPPEVADQVAQAPVVGSLFAAFLGHNPVTTLVPPSVLASVPARNRAELIGTMFFPDLISGPFMHGLRIAFTFGASFYLLAALASWLRGPRYVYGEPSPER